MKGNVEEGHGMANVYDPFSYEIIEDPYPAFKLLRDQYPVYRNEERNFWALSRYADVQSAARDWRTFSSAEGVDLDAYAEGFGKGNFMSMDPPRHDQLRRVVHDWFTPKAVRVMEEGIRTKASTLLESFAHRGEADIVDEFTWPLPLRTVSEMLGIPQEDQTMLSEWFITSGERTLGDPQVPDCAAKAVDRIREYFEQLIEYRREVPGDDLLSHIVTAEVDGVRLKDEAVGLSFILWAGGTDAPSDLISNSVLVLAQHPEQRTKLVQDPSLIPGAIEELMRYESPTNGLARMTTRDVEIHGRVIPKGSRVALLFGSANRDERAFEDPDSLDVTRKVKKRHLGFSDGIHHCVGAVLARLEAKVALELLLSEIPRYQVTGEVERRRPWFARGLTRLPIVF